VRCERSEDWDADDDSDSTYVPSPYFNGRTRCWHHDRPVIPSDTSHSG
jgi:hypothetical protein